MKYSNQTLQNLPYFWDMKTPHSFFFNFSFRATFFPNEKQTKSIWVFVFQKFFANFEAFCWNISSGINLLFLLKSVILHTYTTM